MNKNFPLPSDEAARLAALERYRILDTPAEAAFDDITKIASFICGTPIAVMSLVDEKRQWFKSIVGLNAKETPRELAFCAHTILGPETLVVEDATADARFADNPLVTGEPNIRFYAGAPLMTGDGHALGSLCVIGREKRSLSPEQKGALEALARQVMVQLELRDTAAQLAQALEDVKRLSGMLPICLYCKGIRDDAGYWQRVETYMKEQAGVTFSHGICPSCAKVHFPDMDLEEDGPKET